MTLLAEGTYDVPPGKIAVVTTHLEMLAQAPQRDVHLPDGLTFKRVNPTIAWYRDVYARVGTEWLWTGRLRMDEAELQANFDDPAIATYTIEREGQAEALLELDFREEGACEIAYFGVSEALIGTGAGRYLMNQAIQQAWAQPISRLWVHTCTGDSQQALDFYVRSGFVPFKRQVDIEDDPRLTGLLPRDAARHVAVLE